MTCFLLPVGEGAFAYYAKYNKEDSYGMMDIYKLEVFTDLHPRKFILNGISRVEGQVSQPDYLKMYSYTDQQQNRKGYLTKPGLILMAHTH